MVLKGISVQFKDRVLVDKLVVIDCIGKLVMKFSFNWKLFLGNLSYIGLQLLAFPIRVWSFPYLCPLFSFYRIFVTILNRYIYVFHWCWLILELKLDLIQMDSKHNHDLQSSHGMSSWILFQVYLVLSILMHHIKVVKNLPAWYFTFLDF